MSEIPKDLLNSFRSPAFPGSFFLSFEGIEGAGKSTQLKHAKEFLESKGFRVLVLREPGGTSFGEKLRKAILESKEPINPLAEAHLFCSSRAQLLQEVTLKELNTPGTIVILDRYIDSTIAYQGKARNLGTQVVLELHKHFPLNLVPHKTIYIKISLETSHERQKMRNVPKDYFESQGKDFYKLLISGYEEAAELFPNRITIIDGEKPFDAVKDQITHELDLLIESRDEANK